MVAIKQHVTVQPGGLIEVRSPQLQAGQQAEIIVLVEQAADQASSGPMGRWKRYAGAINSTDANAADNNRIDSDLTRAYGADNKA
jgi:hypothetical protein